VHEHIHTRVVTALKYRAIAAREILRRDYCRNCRPDLLFRTKRLETGSARHLLRRFAKVTVGYVISLELRQFAQFCTLFARLRSPLRMASTSSGIFDLGNGRF
jgi:hypothetical protein